MASIYVLQSVFSKKSYVGSSHYNNPQIRLKAHNAGKTRSTKSGRSWVIIHQELFSTYTEARRRELFLKTGQGRKLLKTWRGAPNGKELVLKTSARKGM